MNDPYKYPFVVVEWTDTVSSSTWRDDKDEDLPTVTVVLSAGWLLRDFPDYVVVAATRQVTTDKDPDGTFSEITAIPRGVIVSVRTVTNF